MTAHYTGQSTAAMRYRRGVTMTAILLSLAATGGTTPAAAARPPTTTPGCASSPVDVASSIVRIPGWQLRVEVDATAHSTDRPVLDVLLERVKLATVEELSRLPGAGDLAGPSPTAAATQLITRYSAVHAVLVAQAWGDCQS